VISGFDPRHGPVSAQTRALEELLVGSPPGLRPGEDNPALGEGLELLVDRVELCQGKPPKDWLIAAPGKRDQGIAEGEVVLEDVGLPRKPQRGTECGQDFRARSFPDILLFDECDEEPREDTDGRAENGDLGRWRGEGRGEGKGQRAGQGGAGEL